MEEGTNQDAEDWREEGPESMDNEALQGINEALQGITVLPKPYVSREVSFHVDSLLRKLHVYTCSMAKKAQSERDLFLRLLLVSVSQNTQVMVAALQGQNKILQTLLKVI